MRWLDRMKESLAIWFGLKEPNIDAYIDRNEFLILKDAVEALDVKVEDVEKIALSAQAKLYEFEAQIFR